VEGLDGFGGAARSIFNVVFVWRAEADEEEFLGWVFGTGTTVQGRNIAVSTKNLLDFIFCHFGGQVLDENVVVGLSQLIASLRVELNSDEAIFALGGFEGFSGVLGVLEANESITTRLVLLVEGYFARDYTSEIFERIFQIIRLEGLVNLSDEHVLLLELGKINSKEILAVRESAAGLSLKGEVAEILLDFFELIGVVDSDHGGVKGFVDVSSNLGLLNINIALLLDESCKLGGGVLSLG